MSLHNVVCTNMTYRGISLAQLPLDMWIYQELLSKLQTIQCIVEIGTNQGGSALALYDMMCAVNQSQDNLVITIDIEQRVSSSLVLSHKHIRRILGSAVTPSVAQTVNELCAPYRDGHIMVIDDGSHMRDDVFAALQLYHSLIKVGGYYIVQDTVCWHGLELGPFPGPYEAVQDFLHINKAFVVDRECEKFECTYNPAGFLRRVQ